MIIKHNILYHRFADSLSDINASFINFKHLSSAGTALQALQAEWSLLELQKPKMFLIDGSDENITGFFCKLSANYGEGLFAGADVGKIVQIVYRAGTWTRTQK